MNFPRRPIKITHITDPSRFYFRFRDLVDNELFKIKEIEKKIKEFAEENGRMRFLLQQSMTKLETGHLVGYFDGKSKKWIRCEVDMAEKFNDEGPLVFLWAIDYGFPFYTSKTANIIPLPDHFKFPLSKILCAGLPVLPTHGTFDHINQRMSNQPGYIWTLRAVETFCSCAKVATEIFFEQSTRISLGTQLLGDVLINCNDIEYRSVLSKLLDMNAAVCVPDEDFRSKFADLIKIDRWNDWRGGGGVLRGIDSNIDPSQLSLTTKADETVLNRSVLCLSEQEAADLKVLEWQRQNSNYFKCQYNALRSSSSLRIRNQRLRFLRKVSEGSRASICSKESEMERLEEDFASLNTSSNYRPKRRSINLPAGASFPVNYRDNSQKSHEIISSFHESEFESASVLAGHIEDHQEIDYGRSAV